MQDICNFVSQTALCSLGLLSNREGNRRCIIPTQERGDAELHLLSPRRHLRAGEGREIACPPGRTLVVGSCRRWSEPATCGQQRRPWALSHSMRHRRWEGSSGGASVVREELQGGGSRAAPCAPSPLHELLTACEIRRRLSFSTACKIRRELLLLPHLCAAPPPPPSASPRLTGEEEQRRRQRIDDRRGPRRWAPPPRRATPRSVCGGWCGGSAATSSSPPAGATPSRFRLPPCCGELEGRGLSGGDLASRKRARAPRRWPLP
jgi:hypothetical protein